jgi:hypothetical protein
MKTIWKYQISIGPVRVVDMPTDAEILTVQMQDSVLTLWALLDPTSWPKSRRFEVYGTGHPIDYPHELKYIGTVQDGPLVWHVFERLG